MKKILTGLLVFVVFTSMIASCKHEKKQEVYKAVKIGNQQWMTKNLSADKFRNGDEIMEAGSYIQWRMAGEKKQPAWCYYQDDPANGEKFGRIYNWYAVNDPRGLAPEGWHIPTDEEWTELTDFLGDNAHQKIKSRSGWEKVPGKPDEDDFNGYKGNGNDESGFNGQPGGFRRFSGRCYDEGIQTNWWTATPQSDEPENAWSRGVTNSIEYGYVSRSATSKGNGYYVRCIKNN